MTQAGPGISTHSNLALRIASAAVLAPVALGAVYFGGWLFAAFWTLAAIAVLWEWSGLVIGRGYPFMLSVCGGALVLAAIILERGRPVIAIMVAALGALAAAIFAPAERRTWIVAGMSYAGALLIAPLLLRADESLGLLTVTFLFAIVWTTDIFGYFAGRAIGGPKLAPAISPKKTWSGAIAGTIGAIAVALLLMHYAGNFNLTMIALIALVLSLVSQAGDLFESAMKRRFGAKDSSNLIPGHGGVMDRLDGFWAAAFTALLIGLARGGFDAPARGLLVW